MLLSLGYLFLFGLIGAFLCNKCRIPSLIGMLLVGVILGPFCCNLLSKDLLNIAGELRTIALIIILIRVGLSFDLKELKKVGRVAFLLCFVPALFEIAGVVLLAPKFLGFSYIEAFLAGTVLAAVSPAVVVPRMLKLKDEGYGQKNAIPQMVMTGASFDDIFVIILFASGLNLMKSGGDIADGWQALAPNLIELPISIVLGVAIGLFMGWILVKLFKRYHMRDSIKVMIVLSVAFMLKGYESCWVIHYSGLLAMVALGAVIFKQHEVLAKRLTLKFSKLWVCAEIVLFVLVGAVINVDYALKSSFNVVFLILIALVFRMLGVYCSTLKCVISNQERLFCMLSYIPKATVQAAIGAVALQEGLACGDGILLLSVVAIIVTAPLGAFLIDVSYKKLLKLG